MTRAKKMFVVEKHVNDERLESIPFSYCMHAFKTNFMFMMND